MLHERVVVPLARRFERYQLRWRVTTCEQWPSAGNGMQKITGDIPEKTSQTLEKNANAQKSGQLVSKMLFAVTISTEEP